MTRPSLDPTTLRRALQLAVIVPVLRTPSSALMIEQAHQAVDMGARILELTTTTPGWRTALSAVVADPSFDHITVGVGTVTTRESGAAANDLGAQFLVSPYEIDWAHDVDVPFIQGGSTPGELARASAATGIAKIFPATPLGPGFLRAIRDVLPERAFMPTGGITLDTAPSWLDAGAIAVGIGGALFADPPPGTTDRLREAIDAYSHRADQPSQAPANR